MARCNGADRQTLEPLHHRLHLPCHRGHQAVVEVAAIFLRAAAAGFGPGVAAEVGGEELAAHQQAGALLEGHQAIGPAGCGGGQQGDPVAIGAFDAVLTAHHRDRWQRGQLFSLLGWRAARGGRLALIPQLAQQLGRRVGGDQAQLAPAPGQLMQQGNAVGVDVPHHHLEFAVGRHQLRQCLQIGRGERGTGGMHQQCGHRADAFVVLAGGLIGGVIAAATAAVAKEQKTVGARASLQSVFQFEAQAPWAQTPQADQSAFDRQLNHTAF